MGIDGSNKLIIVGPSKIIDELENNKIVLKNSDVNNDSNLIYLKKYYLGDNCCIERQKKNEENISNKLTIYFDYRNIPPNDYLKILLEKYPECWIKNEYYTEDGDAGSWIGFYDYNGKQDIQELKWRELSVQDHYQYEYLDNQYKKEEKNLKL